MFKKTALALGVCGLMAASTAQAAMVYDQDGTTLDIYGRIAMGFDGGGAKNGVDNGEEFRNFGSRLRITAGHQITSDLRAFARVEWRFQGDERSRPGFDEVRNSYLGLESEQFGTFMAGNYNSFYDNYVMTPFDVYVERGYEFAGGGVQARGDSLGYKTPEMGGFQAVLSAKHFTERGLTNAEIEETGGSDISAQGGVVYSAGPARLALGFVDDVAIGGGNDEMRYGATAAFEVSSNFAARVGYETRSDNDVYGGGFDKIGVGATLIVDSWKFFADYYNIDLDGASSDRNAWALGSMYKLSKNFDMFLELNDADLDAINNYEDDLYYAVGARYHF